MATGHWLLNVVRSRYIKIDLHHMHSIMDHKLISKLHFENDNNNNEDGAAEGDDDNNNHCCSYHYCIC